MFSFADAKLSKDRIENLFDVDGADYLSNRSQCFVKIDCDIFWRQHLAQRCSRAIARFQRPPETIAMSCIDRECALRPQILFGNARQNFLLQFRKTFSRQAGNPRGMKIFPVPVFRQIALVQNDNFIRVTGPLIKMLRPGRILICDVETQVGQSQRFFGARNSFALDCAFGSPQSGSIEQTDWHTG